MIRKWWLALPFAAACLAIGATDSDDFERCATGPAVPVAGECIQFDVDQDGDVDQKDFGLLQRGDYVTISGRVTDLDGAGIPGILMHGFPHEVYTDSDGYYVGVVPTGWSGTITPMQPTQEPLLRADAGQAGGDA